MFRLRIAPSRDRRRGPATCRGPGSGPLRIRLEQGGLRGAGHRSAEKTVAEPAVKPGSVVDNHSSRPCLAARLKQRTRGRVEPTHSPPIWPCSGWGLPCPAALAPQAVGSYPTVSPSPRMSCDTVRLSILCCTFRRLAPPRRYLAPCSVEPGLSSARSSRDAVVLAGSAIADCLMLAARRGAFDMPCSEFVGLTVCQHTCLCIRGWVSIQILLPNGFRAFPEPKAIAFLG